MNNPFKKSMSETSLRLAEAINRKDYREVFQLAGLFQSYYWMDIGAEAVKRK